MSTQFTASSYHWPNEDLLAPVTVEREEVLGSLSWGEQAAKMLHVEGKDICQSSTFYQNQV